MTSLVFDSVFAQLTGHSPFPWQSALYEKFSAGEFPASCNLPTGLGKTSFIPIWLIALANAPALLSRRLVYVVNRRTVVDQTTDEVEKLRTNLKKKTELKQLRDSLNGLCAIPLDEKDEPLAISTLRGQFADNREWSADPSRPAVICGTVDMIGSRLLFSGYGVGFKSRPLHAGFLGQDALLIHDEAHLEPAFQELLLAIVKEQKSCNEFRKLHVVELSATPYGNERVFELTPEDKEDPVVRQRIEAKKAIRFHELDDEKKFPDRIADLALEHKASQRPVMVFVRTVEAVDKVADKLRMANQQVETLTGTMRGKERDDLVKKPIFRRFMPQVEVGTDTVYLICTSAGEVGVNISADHLVCDLSTFDSMAQRFGRVNRFGMKADTRIDIVYPKTFGEGSELEERRSRTLELLQQLNGDGSPAALSRLDLNQRLAAFSPKPDILLASDILFDAWTLTTIKDKLPGRPPIDEYLHGISEWEPPQTSVAWREDVAIFTEEVLHLNKLTLQDGLDEYPLKPHELLKDRSDRVFKELQKIVARGDVPIWVIGRGEEIRATTLANLVEEGKDGLDGVTLVLPPSAGGLKNGLLNGTEPAIDISADVADDWFLDKEQQSSRRVRVWNDDQEFDEKTKGMRQILRINTTLDPDNLDDDSIDRRYWHWFERPRGGDNDGSKAAQKPVRWQVHTDNVRTNATMIVEKLQLKEMEQAVILAAQHHDLGKKREVWQRSIGHRLPKNPTLEDWFAKSGKGMMSIELTPYRHEFGSLVDVHDPKQAYLAEVQLLSEEMRDLVLHLIAAHHGYGRPHFTEDQTSDWGHSLAHTDAIAREVPRRFARLQRKYGRWGLAYLESLLRAADYAASARPSEFVENHQEIRP